MSLEMQTHKTEEEIQPLTVDRALTTIEGLKAETYARGGNDSEFDAINSATTQMIQGLITPQQAVEAARRILEDKQDYH